MESDIEIIKNSIEKQMELSKLLFEALGMGCWHIRSGNNCRHCDKEIITPDGIELDGTPRYIALPPNPNLFSSWEGFGRVFEAVKDREDIRQYFGISATTQADFWIPADDVSTPSFQLAVLKLLDPEGVEKVLKQEGGGE